jgi:transcriptional regulator with XRE-family HTH domain
MPAIDRRLDRGARRGLRSVQILGEEFRDQRLALGLSQQDVADAAHIHRSRLSRIENGRVRNLSVVEASRIATVLGLDLSVRVYPGGNPLRDAAHAERLRRLLGHVQAPLSYRTEVPLPPNSEHTEMRAWDAMIFGVDCRSAAELEVRISDGQALERRVNLKRRDDPTDRFLLLVADTRRNRRVLSEHPGLFPDLPRVRLSRVIAALEAGQHPPSGLVLI